MRPMLSLLILAIVPGGGAVAEEPTPVNWDAPLCKPVDREQVHAFTREPTVREVSPDRFEISFACQAKGDVAVAIEDAAGRIVRHIGYGVLGANAPAPFQKDSLQQTVYWDGKDEFGKFVSKAKQCRVRVSLGLNPVFDKIIGWHPKDVANSRSVGSIVADADGVYVLECRDAGASQLRKYDHDGNYLQTLVPWDPEKLHAIKIPKRTLPDAKVWRDREPPPGADAAPLMVNYGSTEPFRAVADATCMATAAGKIGCVSKGGVHDVRRLLRLRTDGTTRGEPMEGGRFTAETGSFRGQGHIALSPDGQWVYVTGQGRAAYGAFGNRRDMRRERPPYTWNAVFRFSWDAQGLVVETQDSFVGEASRDPKTAGAGNDNEHFDAPQGLACDAAGRLYVADFGNDRIQVFSPAGEYLKTIPCKQPHEIAVNQKNGQLYALCWPEKLPFTAHRAGSLTLVKFGPFEAPTERFRKEFPLVAGDPRIHSFAPVLGLDSWTERPRLWIVHQRGVVRIYDDTGTDLELVRDFREEVRQDGHTPHTMHGGHMGYIAVDPVRGHVYSGRKNLRRIDPEEGKTWQKIDASQLPRTRYGGVEEVVFGWDGLLYVRSLQYIARFNPDKFGSPIVLTADTEQPFDYGEAKYDLNRRSGETEADLRGVIGIPWAIGGPNGYNNGFGISPRGDVVALIENFQDFELFRKPSASNPTGYFDANQFRRLLEDNEDRFRPTQFPGRHWSHGNLVWRFSRSGQVKGLDALPGLPYSSFGIRTDAAGNIFTGVGYHKNVGGQAHIGGSLAKFAPHGGRLIRDFNTPVELENPPQRPADFLTTGGGRIWGRNMYWAAEGMDQLHFVDSAGAGYPCECYHCKFDTDLYGRSFIPRAYGFHVQVVDTGGNRICQIGRYGNADSPAMKPGDTDIGLGQCSYLATVSDRWLYIADDSNTRIIRVKLDYHQNRILPITTTTDTRGD